MVASTVNDEARRLEVLESYRVLDSSPEEAFDNITRLASEICSTPIALISLVDGARQWFKSRVGLDQTQTPRELAFCAYALDRPEAMVVPDALADPRFRSNALVTGDPNIRFYAGVPLVSAEGCVLGTLCVIDRIERSLSPAQLKMLERLARQVEHELELRRGLEEMRELCRSRPTLPRLLDRAAVDGSTAQTMIDELKRVQRDKDMLVQLLVHDLKSPLTTILLNCAVLGQLRSTDGRFHELVGDLEASANSMQRLVLDLLDIGKSQGAQLAARVGPLELHQLIREVCRTITPRAVLKQQTLRVEAPNGPTELRADRELLRRLLENLVDNASKYSPKGSVITVRVSCTDGELDVCIIDNGPGIAEADRERVFEPFARLELGERCARGGQGLGLAFCKLAVEAHGGRIWVEPNQPEGTRFCVRLPRRVA